METKKNYQEVQTRGKGRFTNLRPSNSGSNEANGKTISLRLVIACDNSGHLGVAGRTWRLTAACRAEARCRAGVVSRSLPYGCRNTTLVSAFSRKTWWINSRTGIPSIIRPSNIGAGENYRNPGEHMRAISEE